MYKTPKLLSALFALTLAFTLCACGGESAPTAPAATPESTEAADTGKEIVGYFNAAGTQIESLQPGINIVKYADGTSRKIFVK